MSSLQCPFCRENLDGLPDGRCPGCGAVFHAASMRAALVKVASPPTTTCIVCSVLAQVMLIGISLLCFPIFGLCTLRFFSIEPDPLSLGAFFCAFIGFTTASAAALIASIQIRSRDRALWIPAAIALPIGLAMDIGWVLAIVYR